MTNLTSVGITAGVPTSGTGTVSTLDGIVSATGGPVGIAPASTPPSTAQPALVVAISPNSVNANGQAVMAVSAPVVVASDQSALPVTQSGSWIVQPGNIVNTSAWKVDGSAVTQPVSLSSTTVTGTVAVTESGTFTVQPGNTPNTSPWLSQLTDASGATPIAGTGSNSVTSATTIFSVDTSGYSGVAVQITSAGVATVTYQGSNDNSTWVSVAGMISTSIGASLPTTTSTGAAAFFFPACLRYFRAQVTSYTSGTVTAFYTLRKDPPSNFVQGQIQTTLLGTPIAVSQSASASNAYSYNHISTDTTTTVKSGSGTLHTICINTLAATGTATVFDNTAGSGTVIAVITAGAIGTLTYDLAFTTGLTIVTAVAAPDITVTYK